MGITGSQDIPLTARTADLSPLTQLHRATRLFWIGPAARFPDNHVSLVGALDGAAICFSTGAMTEVWLKLRVYWRQRRGRNLRLPLSVCLTAASPGCYFHSELQMWPSGDFPHACHRWWMMRWEQVGRRLPIYTNWCRICFSLTSICEMEHKNHRVNLRITGHLSHIISGFSPSCCSISDLSNHCYYENVIEGAHAEAGKPNTQQPVLQIKNLYCADNK